MTATLKEKEAIPAAYPDLPENLSSKAAVLNTDALWARIEAYCRERWSPRATIWTVEGCGEWVPPLEPVAVNLIELWDGSEWTPSSPPEGPMGGYCLSEVGPYRVTATVGIDGSRVAPAPALEAFRRFAEYLADDFDRAGASSYSVNMGGAIQESYSRSASYLAKALQHSGAADLLRPYRRLK